MNQKTVIRANKPYRSAQSALLSLFSVNEHGHETLIVTSSPIPKVAATEICRIFEQPFTITPSIDLLKEVFKIPGRTAWASATGPDAQAAALDARLLHDIKTAWGTLVIITLSPDCGIVASLKSAMDAIHLETPFVRARALVVAHDETLRGQARVDVLMLGL